MIRKANFLTFVMLIATAIALYTQFPNVDKQKISSLNTVLWGVLLVLLLFTTKRTPLSVTLVFMLSLLILGYFFEQALIFFGVIEAMMPYIELLPVPILVYYCTYCLFEFEDEERIIKAVLGVFAIMTIIMALLIANDFTNNFTAWSVADQYIYKGSTHKNSTAQVIGCGLVDLLFFFSPKYWWKKFVKYACVLIMLISLFYVQSRAVLVAIAVIAVFGIFVQRTNKSRMLWGLCIIAGIVCILASHSLQEMLRQAFLIEKYSRGTNLDLNRFSSGRIDYWKIAWNGFLNQPFAGKGLSYCDNFYISVLRSGGIFLGGGFIALFFYRVYKNIKIFFAVNNNEIALRVYQTGVALTVFFLCVSLFEGFPPYGPGVSTMLFWIISGYIDGYERFIME